MSELTFTVLVDNDHRPDRTIGPFPYACEWGLSLWLVLTDDSGEKHPFLLDAGSKGGIEKNAEKLGIDFADAEFFVLSHAHYDHTDGADAFLAANKTAKIYLSDQAEENCYSRKDDGALCYIGIRPGLLEKEKARIVRTHGLTELLPDVYLVPHGAADTEKTALRQGLFQKREDGSLVPDSFRHEQSLVVRTDHGLHVFSPCSHTGMKNIVEEIQAAFPGEAVCSFTGGLHLFRLTEEETRKVGEAIRALPVEKIYTGHCTGEMQTQVLKEMLGDRLIPFASGSSFRV